METLPDGIQDTTRVKKETKKIHVLIVNPSGKGSDMLKKQETGLINHFQGKKSAKQHRKINQNGNSAKIPLSSRNF